MLHHFLFKAFHNVSRSIQDITNYLKKITKEITYKFRETDKKIAEVELRLREMTESVGREIMYLRDELEMMSEEAMMFSADARYATNNLASDLFIHYGVYSIDTESRKGYIGFNVNQFPTIEDTKLYVVPVQSANLLAKAGSQEWRLPEGNNTTEILTPSLFDPEGNNTTGITEPPPYDINNLPNGTIILDENSGLTHRELSPTNHAFYKEVITFEGEEEIVYDKDAPFFIDIFYTGKDAEGNLVVNRSDRQELKYYQL